jgi:hypothetical protein
MRENAFKIAVRRQIAKVDWKRTFVHGKASKDGLNESLEDLMATRPRGDEQAQLDELGNDPGQVGPSSAGQSGDGQQLSSIADAADESVQELADNDQALEAGIIEGVEDAADHPERAVHTHLEYGRPDDLPLQLEADELDEPESSPQRGTRGEEIDVEDLPDERIA